MISCQHPSRHVECLKCHAHLLPHIFMEYNPAEEFCKDVKHPLHPLRLGQRDEFIVCVEVHHQVLYRHAKYLCAHFFLRRQRYPVAYDIVHGHGHGHGHVEYLGGQGLSLGNTTVSLEGGVIVTPGPDHHCKLAPVHPENLESPGSNHILCKNF